MAIQRQQQFLSQMRVDVPFLRSIESASCNDWDLMAGAALAGKEPLILSGLHVVTTGITLATSLILQVADSVLIHFLATASGSLFHVPADEPDQVLSNVNPNISGGWTPNGVNYLGLDFTRAPNSQTSDLIEIIDTTSLIEDPVTAPLAVTTQYKIIISTQDFNQTSCCPIAKVTLDAGGAIVSIIDARNFMFRLGTGGTIPNVLNSYTWPGGRNEAGSLDPFAGADKSISSFKQLNDALETRLWELGGGEHWYSPTADKNVRLATTGSPFVSNGMWMEWVGGANLHWKGLVFVFDNSTATFNVVNDQTTNVAGLTDLISGQCIYVDLDRSTNRTGGTALNAVKGTLATLGTPTIPGSRWVLAWNYNGSIFIRDQTFPVGSSFILATISAAGTVKLSASDSVGAGPYVATVDSVSDLARAAGLTRGFIPGINTTTASVSDFIGGSGDISIGGGFDGSDGHGGGTAVDFNLVLLATRPQDEVRINTQSQWVSNSAANLSVSGNFTGSASNLVLARFATQSGDFTTRNSTLHINGDGSIGFVNQQDGNPGNGGVPATPNPVTGAEVRSKLFTRSNGLSSPNQRDQLCWLQWDGTVTVITESNPY